MSDVINLETLYRQEQRRWMRDEALRRTFRNHLTGSVPYWIVVVALVLYGLSAPHTAGVFDNLTPGWGFIAPVGVKVWPALRRLPPPRQSRKRSPPMDTLGARNPALPHRHDGQRRRRIHLSRLRR